MTTYTTEQLRARLPAYLRSDLSNGDDDLWRTLFMRLGLSSDGAAPNLYEYTGYTFQGDPTGRNSSSKALHQIAADVSGYTLERRQKLIAAGLDPSLVNALPGPKAVGSPGQWAHDGLTVDFWYGSGLDQGDMLFDSNSPGQLGCTILRPAGSHNMEVPFAIHSGNRFRFNVHYPDRLAEAGNIDGTGVGNLVQYAPTFATDHCNDRTGAPANNASVFFFHIDTCITGANTGVFIGEATLGEEDWAVAPSGRVWSTENGRSTGAYYVDIRGMCMDRGVVRRRNVESSTVMCTRNGFGPQQWQDAVGTNLHAYLQKNCTFHTMGARATGFRLGSAGEAAKVRHCAQVMRFRGGVAPPGWTSGGGVDNGRYAVGKCYVSTEDCPNLVTWEADAFGNAIDIVYDGRGKDFYSTTNVVPLIRHLTDVGIAGDLRKPSDDHPGGWWRSVTQFGVTVDYLVKSRNSAGPVIVIPDTTPQGLISFLPGSRFSSWNNNNQHATDQTGYGFQHMGAANNMTLSLLGCRINNHFGNDRIFYGTQDTTGQNTNPDASDFNPNYGMIAGIEREAMQYFGYDSTNLSHMCNIQPFDMHGSYFPIGFPDGDDDEGDDGTVAQDDTIDGGKLMQGPMYGRVWQTGYINDDVGRRPSTSGALPAKASGTTKFKQLAAVVRMTVTLPADPLRGTCAIYIVQVTPGAGVAAFPGGSPFLYAHGPSFDLNTPAGATIDAFVVTVDKFYNPATPVSGNAFYAGRFTNGAGTSSSGVNN